MPDVMKTLLLNPPSFENFDGGASSRWPATREIESYWYPVWLTYPSGMIPGSRLLDASPHKVNWQQTTQISTEGITQVSNATVPRMSAGGLARWRAALSAISIQR